MISSYVQLLARRYRDRLDSEADEFIDFAVDGANRMQTLINDLLAYSRVSTQGRPFEPVNCEDVLDSVLENLESAISDSGAVVTRDRMPSIDGDRTQMSQLFQNLIANALKFGSGALPEVHLGVRRVKGHLAIHGRGQRDRHRPQVLREDLRNVPTAARAVQV